MHCPKCLSRKIAGNATECLECHYHGEWVDFLDNQLAAELIRAALARKELTLNIDQGGRE